MPNRASRCAALSAARRLDKVLSTMKPGDYLFIQYGHNDEKEKGEGVGAFTTYKSEFEKVRHRGAQTRRSSHPDDTGAST